jgi:hypothetical protein
MQEDDINRETEGDRVSVSTNKEILDLNKELERD